jgi:hypothetical protein
MWRDVLMILTPPEIAALWHPPDERFTGASIAWNTTKEALASKLLRDAKEGILLGINRYAGEERPVYLPPNDRVTHMAIIGKIGQGKSTLMHNMIDADIADGRGVCVIDPKGSLVRHILEGSVPPEREGDVVVLDLTTSIDGVFYPPPLNLLAKPEGAEGQSAAGMIISIIDRAFQQESDRFSKTRMAYLLSNALIALYHEPGAS